MIKKYNQLSEIEQYKIKNHISNLLSLSSVDGRFSKSELEVILTICTRYGFPRQEFVDLIKDGELGSDYIVPSDSFEKLEQIFDFITVIVADGNIDIKELDLCKSITQRLKIKPENINNLIFGIIDYLKEDKKFDEVKMNLYAIINF